MEKIFIALATYNGAAYLEPLLESLRGQSLSDWTLLVRDDGSTDGTRKILRRAAREDGRMVLLHDDLGHRGPAGNFGLLMQHAFDRGAEYLLFADQDDVWLPHKIARMLHKMKDVEGRRGADQAVLVHTDLTVVDKTLGLLGQSFWEYRKLDARHGAVLNRLLIWNVVTGCASMLNRTLLRRALPLPPEAAMHDWWVALVAVLFGQIESLAEPTVLYRQHGHNYVGAVRWDLAHVMSRVAARLGRNEVAGGLRTSQRQARALARRFGPLLPAEKRCVIEAYAGLTDNGFFSRRWRLARYGFYCTGWIRNLGLFASI